MSNREKFDSPAFTFGFAEQSKCTYIEILQYPGLVDPLVTEGSLDDEALPLWLSKVPLHCIFSDINDLWHIGSLAASLSTKCHRLATQ